MNIVIIGGSGDIGSACLERFKSKDNNLIFTFHANAQKAQSLIEQYHTDYQSITAQQLDVNKAKAVEEFCKLVADSLTTVDAVVYISGITKDQLVVLMKDEEFDAVLQTNLYGCYYVIKYMIRQIGSKQKTSFVLVSSTGGLSPNAGQANYAASKAGMIGMMRSVSKEYAKKGIRFNCVAPGFIETNMVDQTHPTIKKSIAEIPMKRLGKPLEVANAIYFLASPQSSYITRNTLIVDGGRI